MTTGVQQNPHTASKLRTNDQMANGSVLPEGADAAATGPPAAGAITTGTLEVVGVAGCGGVLSAGLLSTPGTVESGAHPAAPSYQAWSERLKVPAASWRFISSREKGPVGFPSRAI